MKRVYCAVFYLLFFIVTGCVNDNRDISSALDSPYLGQNPPAKTPQPFAPGIVSTEGYEYSGTFTPDLKEFYFIRGEGELSNQEFVVFKLEDGRWQESVISSRVGQPFISPDGMTMHLGRWHMKRTKAGWSERTLLGMPFDNLFIMRLTASSNGTYYFDTYDEENEEFPIRYSRSVNGVYEEPQILSAEINTGAQLNHPYIAPDESYLIWDAKKDGGYGDSDLYISYRYQDGSWSEAINLGYQINTSAWDAAGYVTPDGKYFFFSRTISEEDDETLPNVDIYWVDAEFIDRLRPDQ